METDMAVDENGMLMDGSISIIKVVDPEGNPGFFIRSSDNISDAEALGLLVAATDKLRKRILDNWDDHDEL